MPSGEAANNNLIVFGLTRSWTQDIPHSAASMLTMVLSPISVHLDPHQWYNTMVTMLISSVVYCGLTIVIMCSEWSNMSIHGLVSVI